MPVQQAPPERDESLTTSFELLGKTVRTAGIGALLLAKIMAKRDAFDKRYFPANGPGTQSASDQALEVKVPGCKDIFHLTEESGREYLEYLKEGLE